MNRVPRRITTRALQPRPPWSWRPCFTKGAPRTCLTSHRDPVYVTRGNRRFRAGQRDWLLRLYQHTGVSEASVRRDGYVLYDPVDEWPLILCEIDWLELVDNRYGMVFRVRRNDAVTASRLLDTPDGPRMAVPLDAYSAHEGD